MQEHSPELWYTGCPISRQTHKHLKTHYWTFHCTTERRNSVPPTRTLTQAFLNRKPWEATHPTPLTGGNLHNKEEPQTARIQKAHPKHSNPNKMKRQRDRRRSQDGGGVGGGEHFLPHKFIKRAFKRRVNSTKQLLNAGRGHQAPRKAAQLFERR